MSGGCTARLVRCTGCTGVASMRGKERHNDECLGGRDGLERGDPFAQPAWHTGLWMHHCWVAGDERDRVNRLAKKRRVIRWALLRWWSPFDNVRKSLKAHPAAIREAISSWWPCGGSSRCDAAASAMRWGRAPEAISIWWLSEVHWPGIWSRIWVRPSGSQYLGATAVAALVPAAVDGCAKAVLGAADLRVQVAGWRGVACVAWRTWETPDGRRNGGHSSGACRAAFATQPVALPHSLGR